MTPRNRLQTVRQTILDRLTQDDAAEPRSWEASVELLKSNLLRDLEKLLNTRQTGERLGPEHAEVERSIFTYGLPDFASLSAEAAATPSRLLRAIEEEIERFEPRLDDVRISLGDPEDGITRRMSFVIEATLRVDPEPERVEFDTVLEMDSGQIKISG